MLAIAVERYILVCKAMDASTILTKRRRIVTAVIIVTLILLCWYNSQKGLKDESLSYRLHESYVDLPFLTEFLKTYTVKFHFEECRGIESQAVCF